MASRREWAGRSGRESISKRIGALALRIVARDHGACVYCGATSQTTGTAMHFDHLTPRVSGGSDEATNLVLACRSCNCRRGARPLRVWAEEAQLGFSARSIRAQARRRLPE